MTTTESPVYEYSHTSFGIQDAVIDSLTGYLFVDENGPRTVDIENWTMVTDNGFSESAIGRTMHASTSEPLLYLAKDAMNEIFNWHRDRQDPEVFSFDEIHDVIIAVRKFLVMNEQGEQVG